MIDRPDDEHDEHDEYDEHDEHDDTARLRARVTLLERELERVRSSTRYRLGSAIVDLRTPAGWRRLPAVARAGWTQLRSRRRPPTGGMDTRAGRAPILADSILDEFSHHSLRPELTLRPVGLAARPRPDTALLLAETAWYGNGGRWQHQFSNFRAGNDLDRLVARYRRSGVPTVLWNKEDPVHFEVFVEAARVFDHVVTTDADCVDRYRAELGHDRVGVMPFAAQPSLHHPVGRQVDPRSICFAGAWRGDVHPRRVEQLTMLLDAARAAGDLTIFARAPADRRAEFPVRYHDSIVGEVPYDRMVAEYRRHACFLNVNSVVGSPTMMSRRVFEILACRTPVVSAPSPAIEAMFGEVVAMPSTRREATEVLSALVESPDHRDRVGQLGYRAVMSAHTYQHRVADLCRRVGIDSFPEPGVPTVDAVVELSNRDQLDQALAAVTPLRSSIAHLVAICRDATEVGLERRDDISIIDLPGHVPPGTVISSLPGDGEFVAVLDPGAHYGPAMISDALLATRFVDADAYGKVSSHVRSADGIVAVGSGLEFTNADDLLPGTAIVRRAALATASGDPTDTSFTAVHDAAIATAATKFGVDRFNHVAASAIGPKHGPLLPTAEAFV